MDRSTACKILDVLSDISSDELKRKYRELVIKTHPDAVCTHDYPYTIQEINAAYEYLTKNLHEQKKKASKYAQKDKNEWNAPINANAFAEREILQYYEDQDGSRIGIVPLAKGKYYWIPDEDFSLFLKSLYGTARQIVVDDDEKKGLNRTNDIELLADIAYLLAGQFFDTETVLSLMQVSGLENGGKYAAIYSTSAMLELREDVKRPQPGAVLLPARIRKHRLFVKNESGEELGYLTFKDDRLLFGIVPMLEKRMVSVKMIVTEPKQNLTGKKRRKPQIKAVDVDFGMKLLKQKEISALESINLAIRSRLDR